MLREALRMELGGQYAGGNARMVEKVTRCRGEEFLYVGDHIFTDVNMAKRCLSWRTCMILQELEQEVVGLDQGREEGQQLRALMSRRDEYAALRCHVRSELQRRRAQRDDGGGGICGGDGDGGSGGGTPSEWEVSAVASEERLREAIEACEAQIQPMVETEGAHVNRYWGYLSRAGWADKSHLMRQIEKYADIYTSRISNLLAYTAYFRFTASPQSLQHDVPHAHLKVRSAATGSGDIPRVSPRG